MASPSWATYWGRVVFQGGSEEKQAVLVQRMLQLMTSPWCDAPQTTHGAADEAH